MQWKAQDLLEIWKDSDWSDQIPFPSCLENLGGLGRTRTGQDKGKDSTLLGTAIHITFIFRIGIH